MIHIVFILVKPFSDPLFPLSGSGMILKETTPLRTEMVHHRIKVMSQDVLTCSDSLIYWTKTMRGGILFPPARKPLHNLLLSLMCKPSVTALLLKPQISLSVFVLLCFFVFCCFTLLPVCTLRKDICLKHPCMSKQFNWSAVLLLTFCFLLSSIQDLSTHKWVDSSSLLFFFALLPICNSICQLVNSKITFVA